MQSTKVRDPFKALTISNQQTEEEYCVYKEMNYNMFRYSPVSIWEEDLSEIKLYIDNLKKKGIMDFRDYFKCNPEEILLLTGKVRIVSVNEAALKLYQVESEKELCEGLSLVFNKESYNAFMEELFAISEGKTEFSAETVIRTLKGEKRHVLLKYIVAPGYEDTLSKVFANIIDVTDINDKLARLYESEEKYRKMFEINDDAILISDMESGIVLDANEKAKQLLGLSLDNIVGMNFLQLCPEEEAEYCGKIVQEMHAEGGLSVNTVILHSNGEKMHINVVGRLISLRHGRRLLAWFLKEMPNVRMERKSYVVGDQLQKLTLREREILSLIAAGLTNKHIANRLFISLKTVETHRSNIMGKLNVHKAVDLVRCAMTMGLTDTIPSKQP